VPPPEEEIERGHGPHQRVFQPGLVPEIAADPPARPIAVLVELARKLSQVVERTPVDGNIPNVLRSPCGTSASPTTARNAVSAQGKSI
jgi:hypothetical protein